MQNDNKQKIDFQKINEIANEIPITEYLDSIGIEPEKKQGTNWYYLCNNSLEDHASCCVDTEANRYTCFSCHQGEYGNLLTYLVYELHYSFQEACQKIMAYANIDPSQMVLVEESETVKYLKKLKREHNKPQKEIKRVYGDYSEHDRLSKQPSQTWINEGIPAEIQRKYDVRTCPEKNQILYPIYDENDKYVCDKFRLDLPKDVLDKLGLPKYRYTHSIGGSTFLSGLHWNLDSIKAKNEIIITEGFKGVLHLASWGITNAACAETCNFTTEQINLLISLQLKSVVIAFDQDRSLQQVKSTLGILPRFTNVSVVIDKHGLLKPKDSPTDVGKETWLQLYNERIKLN